MKQVKRHNHPASKIEADGMPNYVKVGGNNYICLICEEVIVLV